MNHRQGHKAAGFSLIEMMIVLVIVAILAGVALPAYQNSMQKSRRSDAYALLMDVASRQEQHMLDRATYTATMTDLGYAADPVVSEEGYYTVDYVACTGGGEAITNCYNLVASAVAGQGQADDALCGQIALRSNGSKESSPKGSTWPANAATDGRCW